MTIMSLLTVRGVADYVFFISSFSQTDLLLCVIEGLNPVWHDTLEFKVHVPQLAFVLFTVFAKNVSIAHYALPYRCMQQGNYNFALFVN